jgi:hypothetical protein
MTYISSVRETPDHAFGFLGSAGVSLITGLISLFAVIEEASQVFPHPTLSGGKAPAAARGP